MDRTFKQILQNSFVSTSIPVVVLLCVIYPSHSRQILLIYILSLLAVYLRSGKLPDIDRVVHKACDEKEEPSCTKRHIRPLDEPIDIQVRTIAPSQEALRLGGLRRDPPVDHPVLDSISWNEQAQPVSTRSRFPTRGPDDQFMTTSNLK